MNAPKFIYRRGFSNGVASEMWELCIADEFDHLGERRVVAWPCSEADAQTLCCICNMITGAQYTVALGSRGEREMRKGEDD